MARAKKDESVEAAETVGVETPIPDVPAASGQGRAVILPSGERRIDYITRRWTNDKASRSLIAKELTEIQGKPVPYQIVFQATKGKPGGPDPVVDPPAEGEDDGNTAA